MTCTRTPIQFLTYPLACLCLFVFANCANHTEPAAPPIRLAVAANFAETLRALCLAYEQDHDQDFLISVGSTGGISEQIRHGAPFDLFFAADSQRPLQLEEASLGMKGTRKVYAQGQLVLWSMSRSGSDVVQALSDDSVQHIALANPHAAPYGLASQQFLERSQLWERVETKIRMAQSIGQAHQFARSGAADWVLTSRSMTITDTDGTILPIEPSLHDPIIQQMIIISDTQPVRDFWQWVQDSPTARAIIANNGYLLPKVP